MSGAVWVPSGPGFCLPPGGQAPLLPGSAWAAASPRHGRSECARFISLLSSGAPTAAEGPPARPRPARQPRPIRSCAHALPGFAAGSEPSGGGHSPRTADSEGSGAGTLGFPSPTFLSRPTGMCSSSRRPAPRGNTTCEPKNYKSLHPPRRGRERDGAGHFWCWVVGKENEQREW